MAADEYSARLGFIKQGTGNNNNNWGEIFNSSFADLLDRALAGTDSHAVTGGTLDLSSGTLPPSGPSPVAGAIQAFTGTLTSDETVTFPSLGGKWIIYNGTSGDYSLLLKTSGMATPIQIPQGAFVAVVCDGTTLFRMDRAQVGRVVYRANSTVDAGELELTGASLLRASFPDLYAKIGTTYGAADVNHFTLPNLYDTGRFIRSRSASIALGTSQSSQNAAHSHTVTGSPAVGTLVTATDGAHNHSVSINDPGHTHSHNAAVAGSTWTLNPGSSFTAYQTGGATISAAGTGISASIAVGAAHSHAITGSPAVGTLGTASSGGTEARPEAIAMLACILY